MIRILVASRASGNLTLREDSDHGRLVDGMEATDHETPDEFPEKDTAAPNRSCVCLISITPRPQS